MGLKSLVSGKGKKFPEYLLFLVLVLFKLLPTYENFMAVEPTLVPEDHQKRSNADYVQLPRPCRGRSTDKRNGMGRWYITFQNSFQTAQISP